MSNVASMTYAPRPLPLRLPRVCVALVGADPAEMLEKAEAVVRDNPFLEFRLDYLKQPAAALAKLRRFTESHADAVCIATCRRAVNGGKFRGSAASQIDILLKAAAARFQMVDLEIESAQAVKPAEIAKLRSRAALVLSFHDFRGTRNLEQTWEKMTAIPADFYKVVTTATRLADNVTMMKFVERKSHGHSVIGFCMGEQGIMSRLLALRAGSAFTFASAFAGEETGPGQITARTLRDVYRINQVDAATKVYGVAGDPVSQSLSPQMMNAAFRRENVNAVYLALHAKAVDDLIACVRNIPIHGLSVTMPYKEPIVEHLDNSDVWTQRTGACNTVVLQHGKLYGFNTDVAGIIVPLERRLPLNGAKILVIGAGGAARAAVFGLKEKGADVYIMNRTPQTAQKLARQAKAKYVKRADLKKYAFDVIINATPLGMEGAAQAPLTDKEIKAKYLLEMVYTNPETPLAKMARAAAVEVIPGIEMFIHQGARQFEIWTGKPAPAAEMYNVVASAIAARAAAAIAASDGDHKTGSAKKKIAGRSRASRNGEGE